MLMWEQEKYNNNQYTFGYITTANGVIGEENGMMRYVRTLTNILIMERMER